MNKFIFCLKIVTCSLLLWIFQCFFNCNSSKSVINKNVKEEILGLKYKRALGETTELKNEGPFDDIKFIDDENQDEGDEALTQEQENVPKIETTTQLGGYEEYSSDDEESETEELCKFHAEVSEKWNKNITHMWNVFCSQTRGLDGNWRAHKWYDVWHSRLSYENYKMDVVVFETSYPLEEKKKLLDKCLEAMMRDFKDFMSQCKEEWNKQAMLEAEKREQQKMILQKADDSYEKEKGKKEESVELLSSPLYKNENEDKKKFYQKLSKNWNDIIRSMWKLFKLKTEGINDAWRKKKWSEEWHSVITMEKTDLQLSFIEGHVPFGERIRLFDEWTVNLLSRFNLFLKTCIAEWNEKKLMESEGAEGSEGSEDSEDVEVD